MDEVKRALLSEIRDEAEREARVLAGEFLRAAEQDREEILSALEFERWLATSCDDLVALAESGRRDRF